MNSTDHVKPLLDAIGGLEDEKLMALEEAAKTLADAASEMLGRRP